jgi:hypothetical protein
MLYQAIYWIRNQKKQSRVSCDVACKAIRGKEEGVITGAEILLQTRGFLIQDKVLPYEYISTYSYEHYFIVFKSPLLYGEDLHFFTVMVKV